MSIAITERPLILSDWLIEEYQVLILLAQRLGAARKRA